jgi:hypothetical protein
VAVTLAAQVRTAHLLVVGEPEVTVSVDGKPAGKGRFDGTVTSGSHTVLVTGPGKVPYRAEIDLKDGETRSVDVTLETERSGALWPWVVGGAVVAAGAAVGGYFLFKSEPQVAPRPPDTLGSLQLARWGR